MKINKTVLPFKLLLKINQGYHLLPESTAIQDQHMAAFKPMSGMTIRQVCQKDGSRFNMFFTKSHMGDFDTACYVRDTVFSGADMSIALEQDSRVGMENIKACATYDHYKFIFYHTHTFINGVRGIPVLVDIRTRSFWHISYMWPNNIPEDELGILIKSYEELKSVSEKFEVMEYFSSIRLCPHCKRVSDNSRITKDPWMYYFAYGRDLEAKRDSRIMGNGVRVSIKAKEGFPKTNPLAVKRPASNPNAGAKKKEKIDWAKLFED